MKIQQKDSDFIDFIDVVIERLEKNNDKLENLHKEYLVNSGEFYKKETPKEKIDAQFAKRLLTLRKEYKERGIDKLVELKRMFLNNQQSDELNTDNRPKSGGLLRGFSGNKDGNKEAILLLKDIKDRVTGQREDLISIQNTIKDYSPDLQSIKSTVNSIDHSVGTKKDDAEEELDGQIIQLKEKLDKAINDVDTITNNYSIERGKVNSLKTDIADKDGQINTLNNQLQEKHNELTKLTGENTAADDRQNDMFKHIMEKEEYAPIIKKLTGSANSDANQFLFTMEAYQTFKSTCSGIKNIHGANEEAAILQLLSQSLLKLQKDEIIDSKELNELINMINAYSTVLKMLTPEKFDNFSPEYHESISGDIKDGSDLVTADYKTLILKGRAQTDDTLIIKAFIR